MTHYDSSAEYQDEPSESLAASISPCEGVGAGNLGHDPEESQTSTGSPALLTPSEYHANGVGVVQDEAPAVPAPSISPRVPRPSGAASGPNAMLTVSQVGIELGVSPQRVRQLISAGWLKAVAVNPRLYLIRRKDLIAVAYRSSGRPKM